MSQESPAFSRGECQFDEIYEVMDVNSINKLSNPGYTTQRNINSISKKSAAFGEQLAAAAEQRTQTGTVSDGFTPTVPPKTHSETTGGPSIAELAKKAMVSAPANSKLVFIPKENTVCSSGRGGQYVYAEYTPDSTAEDPIVRIFCQAESGTYEFTRHIKDIDPRNATYAELAALHGHQSKIGACKTDGLAAVPLGYETGSFMQKQDFISGLRNFSTSEMFSPNILQDAKDLFTFYTRLVEAKKPRTIESTEFTMLMNLLNSIP